MAAHTFPSLWGNHPLDHRHPLSIASFRRKLQVASAQRCRRRKHFHLRHLSPRSHSSIGLPPSLSALLSPHSSPSSSPSILHPPHPFSSLTPNSSPYPLHTTLLKLLSPLPSLLSSKYIHSLETYISPPLHPTPSSLSSAPSPTSPSLQLIVRELTDQPNTLDLFALVYFSARLPFSSPKLISVSRDTRIPSSAAPSDAHCFAVVPLMRRAAVLTLLFFNWAECS